MKMMRYILTEMSAVGIEKLPLVLDELGYSGRYTILDHCITINSNMSVLSKAIKMAEDLAHNERGHLVCIKKESYSRVWIPETEAETQEDAYLKAVDMVNNGWKVDNDPEISVKAPVEDIWHDAYFLEQKRERYRKDEGNE